MQGSIGHHIWTLTASELASWDKDKNDKDEEEEDDGEGNDNNKEEGHTATFVPAAPDASSAPIMVDDGSNSSKSESESDSFVDESRMPVSSGTLSNIGNAL